MKGFKNGILMNNVDDTCRNSKKKINKMVAAEELI
jgi:hypothetical protein